MRRNGSADVALTHWSYMSLALTHVPHVSRYCCSAMLVGWANCFSRYLALWSQSGPNIGPIVDPAYKERARLIHNSGPKLKGSLQADSRLAPSQWEMLLQSNAVSHWLGANLESALHWTQHLDISNLIVQRNHADIFFCHEFSPCEPRRLQWYVDVLHDMNEQCLLAMPSEYVPSNL